MTDHIVAQLRREVSRMFGGARQITVLEERDGRLIPVGEATSTHITSAAMLLASVHIRLPRAHTYASASIPGPALLRGVQRSDRGSILLAPVLDGGVAIGAVVVEGRSGQTFTLRDLSSLEAITGGGSTMSSQA